MNRRYLIASGVMLLLLGGTTVASYQGWGLTSDSEVLARSAREGSLRTRSYYGGGSSFGK